MEPIARLHRHLRSLTVHHPLSKFDERIQTLHQPVAATTPGKDARKSVTSGRSSTSSQHCKLADSNNVANEISAILNVDWERVFHVPMTVCGVCGDDSPLCSRASSE